MRAEALYFAPQAMTKIMNEGWATFWHSTILTERALEDDELLDYADAHAGTLAAQPGQLNPYKLGLELWRDIQDRWDRGRFGPEWSRCEDWAKRRTCDTRAGLGRQKVFEVRRAYNDVTFAFTSGDPAPFARWARGGFFAVETTSNRRRRATGFSVLPAQLPGKRPGKHHLPALSPGCLLVLRIHESSGQPA